MFIFVRPTDVIMSALRDISDVDELRRLVQELSKSQTRLVIQFDTFKKLSDLFVCEAIDKYKYIKLSSMLEGLDPATVEMAREIIRTQHLKHYRRIMAEKPIPLFEDGEVIGNKLECQG